MNGNVIEWCDNCYNDGFPCSGPVLRGGHYASKAGELSARTFMPKPNSDLSTGFRLVLEP
jgi:formylglycine-generating enzyme required for sulfatase activity